MFGKNSLKTTALAICGAFVIGISSGTAQASVAEQISTVSNASLPKNFLGRYPPETLRQRKERLEQERRYERDRDRFYRDYYRDRRDDYRRPAPPPPPGRGNPLPPPPPPGRGTPPPR